MRTARSIRRQRVDGTDRINRPALRRLHYLSHQTVCWLRRDREQFMAAFNAPGRGWIDHDSPFTKSGGSARSGVGKLRNGFLWLQRWRLCRAAVRKGSAFPSIFLFWRRGCVSAWRHSLWFVVGRRDGKAKPYRTAARQSRVFLVIILFLTSVMFASARSRKGFEMPIQERPRIRAPELTGHRGWLNTDKPLSLAALKGKVGTE